MSANTEVVERLTRAFEEGDVEAVLALLYELRDGKIVRLESFSELEEGLRAAGIED